MDLYLIAAGILIAFLAVTYLIKRFIPNSKTYWLVSMIKTKRFLPVFERFSRHKRIIDFVSVAGLFLGFGAIAVDYYWGRKLSSRIQRLLLFFFSAFVLFEVFGFLFGQMMADNPLTGEYFLWFSVIFGFTGFAGFTIASLFYNAWDILFKMQAGKQACPGVAPIIPGVELPNVPIFVPLHAWISILIILVIHEGFHGIQALRQKIKIKNSGLLLLGFLPIGAFVEPDEGQVKALDKREEVKIYSAGPSANLFTIPVFFAIFFLFIFAVVQPFFSPWATQVHEESVDFVFIESVDQNVSICGKFYESPSFGLIDVNWTVLELNGKEINTESDLMRAMPVRRNEPIHLTLLDSQNQEVKRTIEPTALKWYGFKTNEKLKEGVELPFSYTLLIEFVSFLTSFVGWLALLSLLIAIVNFLPLEPFDGGKIAKIIFPTYFGFWKTDAARKEKVLSKVFFIVVLILLILNALPLFFF